MSDAHWVISNIALKWSHTLSDKEIMVLNYELDQHIPYPLITIPSTPNLSYFTKVFYAIIPIYPSKTWHMLKQNYEILAKNNYHFNYPVKAPFKYKEVIKKLPNNNSKIILKKDKGRGVVITNRIAYLEKCLNIT